MRLILTIPTTSVWHNDEIISKINHLIKGRIEGLVLFFVMVLTLAYFMQWLLSDFVLILFEALLFLYLFQTGQQRVNVTNTDPDHYRANLIQLINKSQTDTELEDRGQPIEQLESQVRTLVIHDYFKSTLVLVFLFLALGWLGLVLFVCLYKVPVNQFPAWYVWFKKILEIPVGLLGAFSVALAGRMDSVLNEFSQWQPDLFVNGLQMFELALITGANEEQEDFLTQLKDYQAICFRVTYVWVFVVALVSIS